MGRQKNDIHLVSPTSTDSSSAKEHVNPSIALHSMFSGQDGSPSSQASQSPLQSASPRQAEGGMPIHIESTTDFLLLGILQALQEANAIKKAELELKLAMIQKEQAMAQAAQQQAEEDEDYFEKEVRWKMYT